MRGLLGLLIEQVTELGRLYATAARQEVKEGLNHLKIALVFFGVMVDRIHGLHARFTAELARVVQEQQ